MLTLAKRTVTSALSKFGVKEGMHNPKHRAQHRQQAQHAGG
jgi:hypothetical protein